MTTEPSRWLFAALAVLLWLALAAGIALANRRRGRRAAPAAADAVLVAVASQTGFGEALGRMTVEAMEKAGVPAAVLPIGELDLAGLSGRRVLFIASTTGEGDAPDEASGFVRRLNAPGLDLSGLSYAVLALGDRSYDRFCAFGAALDAALSAAGASALFDRVEVDDGDTGDIRRWQHNLNQLTGATDAPDWTPPAYQDWSLGERALANPGSPGGEAWMLTLRPPPGVAPDWRAGDIAEVGPPARPGEPDHAHREYSIASVPGEGGLRLLVRLMTQPDGTAGVASGWLCRDAVTGDRVPLRIRANRAFHGPAPSTPVILIGNGTGLAGLRAHLAERAGLGGAGEAWLMFGERTAAHDSFHDADLRAWLASGVLTRLDRTFSRDPGDGRYVQALIEAHAAEVRDWIARGAGILVCGSLEGMSRGVHAALETALTAPVLTSLQESGRYRRDVY